jgi:carboxyl-terminal processing protease
MVVGVRAVVGKVFALSLLSLVGACGQQDTGGLQVTETEPPIAPQIVVPPAGQKPTPPATSFALVNPDVLGEGFRQIDDLYLTKVDFAKLAMDGIANLDTIDESLVVRPGAGRVEIDLAGATLASFTPPASTDASGWAEIASETIETLAARSRAAEAAGVEALYKAVFDGVTHNLDPYSRYTAPDQSERERSSREGYSGIGISLGEDPSGLLIISEVFPGGPADQAGVRQGERILAVEGKPTAGRTVAEIADDLRGPANSFVSITLGSTGAPDRTVVVQRERVVPTVVFTSVRDGVVLVRVTRFNATTSANVASTVMAALRGLGANARGIILDMRGNPGGYLQQAVDVADLFVDQGEIVSTRGRNPASVQYYYSDPIDIASHLPLVVLLDQHSASSAEVTAAALQDTGRAIVVGSSSFGKGSVQKITMLPNGGDLYLTWSRIYSPGGYTLHRQGVTPTICTSASGEAPSVDALIAAFQDGSLAHDQSVVQDRLLAPDDEAALRRLRDACPWSTHDPDIDVQVALRVIGDPTLYAMGIAEQGGPAPVTEAASLSN